MTLPIRRDRVRPGAAYQRRPAAAPKEPVSGVLGYGLRAADHGLQIKKDVLDRLVALGLVKRMGVGGWRSVLTPAGRDALKEYECGRKNR